MTGFNSLIVPLRWPHSTTEALSMLGEAVTKALLSQGKGLSRRLHFFAGLNSTTIRWNHPEWRQINTDPLELRMGI